MRLSSFYSFVTHLKHVTSTATKDSFDTAATAALNILRMSCRKLSDWTTLDCRSVNPIAEFKGCIFSKMHRTPFLCSELCRATAARMICHFKPRRRGHCPFVKLIFFTRTLPNLFGNP